jgi:hypothetical protein
MFIYKHVLQTCFVKHKEEERDNNNKKEINKE